MISKCLTSWPPPSYAILLSSTAQECVDFRVLHCTPLQIFLRAMTRYDQVTAVNGGRYLYFWYSSADELQERHGRRRIVASYAIGPQV